MQSPVGLVPKANNKTRLKFHLSYDFGDGTDEARRSFNFHTPKDLCSIHYNDLDHSVKNCLDLLRKASEMLVTRPQIYLGKSDLSNAFKLAPALVKHHKWLVLKAQHPVSGKVWFFIDLCMPFGASISCAIFQAFSDALKHIMEWILKDKALTNYLDDFLFLALLKQRCDYMMEQFLQMCKKIGCPVSLEKTEWASEVMVFLGVLLDGRHHVVSLPLNKCKKAVELLTWAIQKRKVTVKFVQMLTGTLNFLS